GTYPCQPGGVSVWCDQLIRGMAPVPFDVVAITATDNETATWPSPANVRSMTLLPLWGKSIPGPSRALRREPAEFTAVHQAFIGALLAPPGSPPRAFLSSLERMTALARDVDVSALLRGRPAFERLVEAWPRLTPTEAGVPQASLADALQATDFLEHYLRPLWHPPIQADLCHAVSNG